MTTAIDKQDKAAGRALHAKDPWLYHALTDRIPDPDGCCAEARNPDPCGVCYPHSCHQAETGEYCDGSGPVETRTPVWDNPKAADSEISDAFDKARDDPDRSDEIAAMAVVIAPTEMRRMKASDRPRAATLLGG